MEPELQVPLSSSLVECDQRALSKQQEPCVIWFTGLSGAGKSTLAEALESSLQAAGLHTYLLDGDRLRLGLNRDLVSPSRSGKRIFAVLVRWPH